MTKRSANSSLAKARWVRIMCDYTADGVWDRRGRACRADDLPISTALITRLRLWQRWYERRGMMDDDGEDTDDPDLAAFAAEGLAIAHAVKAALPDWTVIYFDEAKAAEWSPGMSRASMEYEIKPAS